MTDRESDAQDAPDKNQSHPAGEPSVESAGGGAAGEGGPSRERRGSERRSDRRSTERRNVVDRRAGLERRVLDIGSPTGLERRRGPGRRRGEDRRSAEEGEMTDEQFEFVMAVDTYKRLNNRPFPTWTEVLEVVKQLGYRKVAASTLVLPTVTPQANTAPVSAAPLSAPSPLPVKPSEYYPG